jgi:hypothetical protein
MSLSQRANGVRERTSRQARAARRRSADRRIDASTHRRSSSLVHNRGFICTQVACRSPSFVLLSGGQRVEASRRVLQCIGHLLDHRENVDLQLQQPEAMAEPVVHARLLHAKALTGIGRLRLAASPDAVDPQEVGRDHRFNALHLEVSSALGDDARIEDVRRKTLAISGERRWSSQLMRATGSGRKSVRTPVRTETSSGGD